MPTVAFSPTTTPTNQTLSTSFPVRCTSGLAVTAQFNSTNGGGASGNILRHPTLSDTIVYSVHRTLANVPSTLSYGAVNPLTFTGTGDWQAIPLHFYSRTTAVRPSGVYSDVLTITLIF